MTRRRSLYCFALLLLCPYPGAEAEDAPAIALAVVQDQDQSDYFVRKAHRRARCLVSDLVATDTGRLFVAEPENPFTPGLYRLHVPLSLFPLGHPGIGPIQITLRAGQRERTITALHFDPTAGLTQTGIQDVAFNDFTLDFPVVEKGRAPASVEWAIEGKVAEKNRLKMVKQPKKVEVNVKTDVGVGLGDEGNEEDLGVDEIDFDAPEKQSDGSIPFKELQKLPYRLAVCGAHVERLDPVAIESFRANKLVYRPRETGRWSVTIRNLGLDDAAGVLRIERTNGLKPEQTVSENEAQIPAGKSVELSGEFSNEGAHWGAELTASFERDDATSPKQTEVLSRSAAYSRRRASFAVSANFWETAIAYFTDTSRIGPKRGIPMLREHGFTVIECYFWAPDEFGDFTPATERFFSGQHTYPSSVTLTRDLVKAGHENGMAATVYANLWGGDGPPSFEMMRKHPDWFWSAGVKTYWLEDWSLMQAGKIPRMNVWPYTQINRNNSEEALRVHASELVASHRMFGWDGVRYDSYYSDGWTRASTKLVKELVSEEVPDFRWGYNSIVPADLRAKALDIMVGDGGLIMEEGIRKLGESPGPFAAYANKLISYRESIWEHGGHLGVCYGASEKDDPIVLDAVYLSSILLASGGHPYGHLEHQLGQYPAFALRYSEFLYNNRMKPLPDPESMVKFEGEPDLMEWKRLARRLELPEWRGRLVLHLLNGPAVDRTRTNFGMKTPPPILKQALTVSLPEGAKATGAWLLSPIPEPRHDKLGFQQNGNAARLVVPKVRFWGVVVLEYTGVEAEQ